MSASEAIDVADHGGFLGGGHSDYCLIPSQCLPAGPYNIIIVVVILQCQGSNPGHITTELHPDLHPDQNPALPPKFPTRHIGTT